MNTLFPVCLSEKSILHTISQESSKGTGDCGCRKEKTNTNGLLIARVPHTDHIHRPWCVSLGNLQCNRSR